MPSASMAEAMVLAVYVPAPAPGQDCGRYQALLLVDLARDELAVGLERGDDVEAHRYRGGWCRRRP